MIRNQLLASDAPLAGSPEPRVAGLREAAAAHANRAQSHGFAIYPARTVAEDDVSWLWENTLVAGKLNILAGAPGSGKTTLALAMAATITAGAKWPDGTTAPQGDVMIWSGEDSVADVLVPRLRACGADIGRVYFVGGTRKGESPATFNPAHDIPALQSAMLQGGNWKLLIIDTIVSALPGAGSHAGVRKSLEPLGALAQKTGCAVLGIAHFRKGSAGREPLERVDGSVGLGAYARMVLAAARRKPQNGGKCVLTRAKSNLGLEGGGFVYGLEPVEMPGPPARKATRVVWGEALAGSAQQILAEAEAPDRQEQAAALGEVEKWLTDLMAEEGGRVETRDVLRSAAAFGYKARTVYRARARLGIRATRTGFGKQMRSVWTRDCLPGAA
jgi:putative DNA primase/helicase